MAKPWSFLVIEQKIYPALYPTKRQKNTEAVRGDGQTDVVSRCRTRNTVCALCSTHAVSETKKRRREKLARRGALW